MPNDYNTPSWGGDFSGSLNDILAPYQRMAQQVASPYATMRPDSWLAQNHPKVAGVLDNAFLTAGMTPEAHGPEGVGGGISRMMQGLMGAQQFKRQNMMQGAMLPYQMAMGQLQARDTLSQIHEREAMSPYYKARSDWYENRMTQGDRDKFVPGGLKTDDKGNEWQEIFDPVAGKTRLFDPVSQKHADELPVGQVPTFENERKNQRRAASGGLVGEIIDQRMSSDPAVRARGQQMAALWSQMQAQEQGAVAGARTYADQTAPHPYTDTKEFIKNEREAAYGTVPKVQDANEYKTNHFLDADYWKDPDASYNNYIKGIQAMKQQMDVSLGKYEKSSAPSKGLTFQDYMKNPLLYDGSAPAAAPSAAKTGVPNGW